MAFVLATDHFVTVAVRDQLFWVDFSKNSSEVHKIAANFDSKSTDGSKIVENFQIVAVSLAKSGHYLALVNNRKQLLVFHNWQRIWHT